MKILFWLFIGIISYVYFGYPLLLIILSRFIKMQVKKGDIEPSISMIIAAYNEEKTIREKLENTLALDYPKDKLEIIVASDGSTDRTNEIVREFEDRGVKLVYEPSHKGKSSIQNKAVKESFGEILIFSDATSIYEKESLKKLIANFSDQRVGCITTQAVYTNLKEGSTSEGEGIYWKYELFLRRKESDIGMLSMASGWFFAVRKELFIPLRPNTSDDFILPMNTVKNALRVVYEPEAKAYDKVANSAYGLFRTKVRIIAKDLRSLFYFKDLLNPFSHFAIAWSLVSHKLLRWLIPFFLIAIFVCNLALLSYPFYQMLFFLQVLFYFLAFLGYFHQKFNPSAECDAVPFPKFKHQGRDVPNLNIVIQGNGTASGGNPRIGNRIARSIITNKKGAPDFGSTALTIPLSGRELWSSTKRNKLLEIPFSFCIINVAALVGICKFLTGRVSGKWEVIR